MVMRILGPSFSELGSVGVYALRAVPKRAGRADLEYRVEGVVLG